MLMPPISRYMTRQPWTICRDASLDLARKLMKEHGVRHLPVIEGGELVGVISERDVFLVDRLRQLDRHMTVEDGMTIEVYGAHSGDPVDQVVETMAERKIGCAVVLDQRGHAEGIFTTVDALRVLSDVLGRATA